MREGTLSEEDRRALLALAREAIAAQFRRSSAPQGETRAPLDARAGVFVTVKVHGELGGCIVFRNRPSHSVKSCSTARSPPHSRIHASLHFEPTSCRRRRSRS